MRRSAYGLRRYDIKGSGAAGPRNKSLSAVRLRPQPQILPAPASAQIRVRSPFPPPPPPPPCAERIRRVRPAGSAADVLALLARKLGPPHGVVRIPGQCYHVPQQHLRRAAVPVGGGKSLRSSRRASSSERTGVAIYEGLTFAYVYIVPPEYLRHAKRVRPGRNGHPCQGGICRTVSQRLSSGSQQP